MPSSKKNLKATKKFEKKHLKGVLERRKATAKIKQRAILKEKKKTKRSQDAEYYHGAVEEPSALPEGTRKDAKVSVMSVDDFFAGGFEILDKKGRSKAKGTGAGKLGKRKREETNGTAERDDGTESESEASFDEQIILSDDGSEPFDSDADEGEGGMSKQTMDNLAKSDPEFYKFLKENDPEALDFDQNADLAEVAALSGSDDEDDEQPKKKRKKNKGKVEEDDEPGTELTRAMVARWQQSMAESHSLRAARQVVLAFRSAASQEQDDQENSRPPKFKISNPNVYQELLVAALTQVPAVIVHHVPIQTSSSGKVSVTTTSKKFKGLSVLIKTYVASVINLLSTLSDEENLKLTISSLTPILPHLLGFRKLLRALMKTVIAFWSQPASSETTRITAFLVMRKIVEIGDRGARESVLKATYQSLVQGCRKTNTNTIQGINIMKNSAAELWGIDQTVGYTTAFVSIRKLALHLRNSIVHNKRDAYRAVYNWQYTHSLDFWSCVLAQNCNAKEEVEAGTESKLKLLIYPLVQVTLGAMGLVPSPAYFPFRFHLIRSLLRISRSTGTYIPLAASLLEVLNAADMKKPPKSASLKPLDFAVAYKAPTAYLRTRVYQDGVGEQVVELFGEYFVLWTKSIAFPEFALPVIIQLRRWLKSLKGKGSGNKNPKLTSLLVVLVQKLDANGKFIEERRATVDFAPKDRAQVNAFLRELDWEKTPLGAYVMVQRKLKAEKERIVAEARKEEEKKQRKEREARDGDEDVDVDDDVEMEDESDVEETEELLDEAGFGGFEEEDEEMEELDDDDDDA